MFRRLSLLPQCRSSLFPCLLHPFIHPAGVLPSRRFLRYAVAPDTLITRHLLWSGLIRKVSGIQNGHYYLDLFNAKVVPDWAEHCVAIRAESGRERNKSRPTIYHPLLLRRPKDRKSDAEKI